MSLPQTQALGPIMLDIEGLALTDADCVRLMHPLCGGVILFGRNYQSPQQVTALTEEMHSLRSPALLIAVDHEGGRVQRFRDGFTPIPPMRALGRLYDAVECQGLPAALVTGVMHGAIRSSPWSESTSAHEQESGRLNLLLCEKASGARYATMLWCYYEPLTRLLCYVNAGHYPPLLISDRGQGSKIVRLDAGGGPVLGILPAARYQQARFEVWPGDVLVLYSDGLTEAANAAGEEYGERRLREFLATAEADNPDAIRDAILASVSAFLGAAPPRDDLTLVVAKFT